MRFPPAWNKLYLSKTGAIVIVKTLLLLLSLLMVANLSPGQQKQQHSASGAANAGKPPCPLCKLPGRATLFAGGAKRCHKDCAKLCCKGASVVFVIRAIADQKTTDRVKNALSSLEGVLPLATTRSEPDHVKIRYAPDKVTREKLRSVISKCGFEITGEEKIFTIEGLKSRSVAAEVEQALRKQPGISEIKTVCPVSQRAVVVFDPRQTSTRKITATINSTASRAINP